MKTIYTLLILMSFPLVSQAQFNGHWSIQTIPAPSLSNNLLGEPSSREMWIYLPPSYHEVDYAFPVLYFLEGFTCSQSPYQLITEYDRLLSQDDLEEMIVVIIEGCNTLRGGFYVNSAATGNWEDFIRYDLVNYIDLNYRTIRKNQCRGIAGHSMGGFGAISLAMQFPDIFKSMYAQAPALYNNKGAQEWFDDIGDNQLKLCIDYLESLKADDAESELDNLLNTYYDLNVDKQITIAEGAAFCPDTSGHVPYAVLPYSLDEKRNLIKNDSIMNIWDGGRGKWDQKVALYSDNLASLDTLIIDYGIEDQYPYIPRAVQYLHNVLEYNNVEHTMLSHPGGHFDANRFHMHLFPAMSKTLWRDSSRFRTGTEILSCEVENQIQEAIIDSGNGTVEAFVSDTTNIEAIRLHFTLSDGAWETPMANQELDFSWGPIAFKVTSGDYRNHKLWTVTITQVSTSYIDVIKMGELSSFPNPTSGIINFTGLTNPVEVRLYSIQGKLIKSVQQVESTVDISDLPCGLYFLTIKTQDNQVIRQKIIKQ